MMDEDDPQLIKYVIYGIIIMAVMLLMILTSMEWKLW